MAEYIDKAAALEVIEWLIANTYADATFRLEADEARRKLFSLSAADVRPVVRGIWIGIDDDPFETWECSNCGKVVEGEHHLLPNYCPDCGADMWSGSA